MTKIIGARVTDEVYSKVLGKCVGLGCTPSDYLRMLIETDTTDSKPQKVETEGSKPITFTKPPPKYITITK